jgi:hypothetical protein
MKVCPDCTVPKDASCFGANSCSPDGLNCYCKPCHAARSRKWRENFPQKQKATRKKYYRANKKEIAEKRKAWSYTISGRFALAKRQAKNRKLEWIISKEQYAILAVLPCDYCGGPHPKMGVGLDRKDNNLGYIAGNVVPCCGTCNDMKGHLLSYEEMKAIWKARKAEHA